MQYRPLWYVIFIVVGAKYSGVVVVSNVAKSEILDSFVKWLEVMFVLMLQPFLLLQRFN